MINNITIKSGIDINSDEFKNYLELLKKEKINSCFLDLALSNNTEVLTKPFVFDEKEYKEYKIDDISFIIYDDNIIGHMVYTLQKERPVIPLSLGTRYHLDLERAKQIPGRLSFNKLDYFCKYNININDNIINYLSTRIHSNLEYKGNISIENKIHIKK